MDNLVIKVVDIAQPAPGKKQGKVYDENGRVWQVWADKLHLYQQGQSYNITYKTTNFNGQDYHTIDKASPVGSSAISPPPARGPAPAATAQASFVNKDEMIFVCGALNNTLSNPNINVGELTPTDIIEFVQKYQAAWRATLGKKPGAADDIGDSIPF